MSVNNKKILLLYNYLYENSFINYYKWLIDFYIFDDCWCIMKMKTMKKLWKISS